jgi:hypothetical protein
MPITVTISKTLDDIYATEEQLQEMSDSEIIELVKEDLTYFVDGASWTVDRTETKKELIREESCRKTN